MYLSEWPGHFSLKNKSDRIKDRNHYVFFKCLITELIWTFTSIIVAFFVILADTDLMFFNRDSSGRWSIITVKSLFHTYWENLVHACTIKQFFLNFSFFCTRHRPKALCYYMFIVKTTTSSTRLWTICLYCTVLFLHHTM